MIFRELACDATRTSAKVTLQTKLNLQPIIHTAASPGFTTHTGKQQEVGNTQTSRHPSIHSHHTTKPRFIFDWKVCLPSSHICIECISPFLNLTKALRPALQTHPLHIRVHTVPCCCYSCCCRCCCSEELGDVAKAAAASKACIETPVAAKNFGATCFKLFDQKPISHPHKVWMVVSFELLPGC